VKISVNPSGKPRKKCKKSRNEKLTIAKIFKLSREHAVLELLNGSSIQEQ
jgi:hypothetical protein